MKSKKPIPTKYIILAGIFSAILFLDQWTKHLVHTQFRWGESKPIVGSVFSLTYVRNKGAAFGMLNNAPEKFRKPFFLIIPLFALGLILFFFKKLEEDQLWVAVALSLILSGAIGNMIDRARFGYVIDFLDFYYQKWHYPAFNVADSAIVIGVGMMFIHSFQQGREEAKAKAGKA